MGNPTDNMLSEKAFAGPQAELVAARWGTKAAIRWYSARAWPCGFNYLPASAVNFVDMWQADGFDSARIETELGWATKMGLNSPRTNLPFVVWRHDRDGLLARLDQFLDIAARHNMTTVICLMDDCAFSGLQAGIGVQPVPLTGIHNSRAVASPGREVVMDPGEWPHVESYIRDIVGRHAEDGRVLFWDLYNEPGNRMIFAESGDFSEYDIRLEAYSHQLMLEAFGWCREIAPSQPLTVGGWRVQRVSQEAPERVYTHPTDLAAFELSDIVSFHAYTTLENMKRVLGELAVLQRPLICTEWMARAAGSRLEEQLPLLRANNVGSWHWGLVNGKTQTHLPWPHLTARSSVSTAENATEWFHDLLNEDGTPYSPAEVELIRRLVADGFT